MGNINSCKKCNTKTHKNHIWKEFNKSQKSFSKDQNVDFIRKLIRDVVQFLTFYNIDYWLEGGSLLGSYRNRDIIPWDDDADIGMLHSDYLILKRHLPMLPDHLAFRSLEKNRHKQSPLKAKIVCKKTGLACDIFVFEKTPMNRITAHPWTWMCAKCNKQTFDLDESVVFPLQDCVIGDTIAKCPNDTHTYLIYQYSDNLNPDHSWNEQCQCWQKI